MPPRPNQNVGKALVLFVGGITLAGLGIGAVYLPFFSDEGRKRAAAVARGEDANEAVLGEETGAAARAGGGSRGSMWKKGRDQG